MRDFWAGDMRQPRKLAIRVSETCVSFPRPCPSFAGRIVCKRQSKWEINHRWPHFRPLTNAPPLYIIMNTIRLMPARQLFDNQNNRLACLVVRRSPVTTTNALENEKTLHMPFQPPRYKSAPGRHLTSPPILRCSGVFSAYPPILVLRKKLPQSGNPAPGHPLATVCRSLLTHHCLIDAAREDGRHLPADAANEQRGRFVAGHF